MKTLFIGKIWPEPSSSAAGKRSIDVMRALLRAGWEVVFACAAQRSDRSENLETLLGIETQAIALNSSTFDEWIRGLAPDVVVFDRFMTEEQYGWRVEDNCPDALRVIDTSDLHFLREARREQLRKGGELDLLGEPTLREIAAMFRCDLSLVISEFELELLRSRFGFIETQVAYWPFVVEPPLQDTPSFEERRHCMMIGSFLHEPNWDAVQWCRNEIWPAIRARIPDLECHVYGSYPPPKAYQLNSDKLGFRVMGPAEDALSTMSRYRLNLAPLRFGAGLKGKLIDAFRAGTPSVATSVAIEGMAGALPWGSGIADGASDFARSVIALHESSEAWTFAREAGYRIARERFSPEDWLPRLPQLLAEAHSRITANRHANYLGRMLRQQERRSAEYMSRWIEAKNRR